MLTDDLNDVAFATSPGCAVGVLRSGQASPEFVFHGRAARDGGPISDDTLWEAASLSKPVVALLALERSVTEPDLLTAPLATTGEGFGLPGDDRWSALTLEHAITHTTGFPNWRADGEALSFATDPGTPGYSGEGYELLLAELAARTDLSAEVFLEAFLQRLGMTRSSFTPDRTALTTAATGHDARRGPLPKMAATVALASGSLHTTVGDYLHFLSLVARPGDVADHRLQAAVRRMADRAVETLPGHGRTLGWAYTTTASGDVLWQHGDNPGFKHIAVVSVATGTALVVFTNSDDGQAIYRDVCRRLLAVEVW